MCFGFRFNDLLDARIRFAKAKNARQLGLDDDDQYNAAIDEVEAWGIADYKADRLAVPLMIANEPVLVAAWNHGFDFASDLEEMAACDECQNGTGNPCAIHG